GTMGITVSDLHILDRVLRDPELRKDGPVRIACLGYSDVILNDSVYEKFFHGTDWRAKLVDRPNRDKLIAIHGGDSKLISVVPTLDSFFSLYGDVKVDVIDYAQYEGSEIVHDMSEPVPETLRGKYDVVIDGGTTEHIFDIAAGLFNCARMVKLGGIAYHNVPLNMLNHGFYNISPTLFFDFYEDNGFTTAGCVGVATGVMDDPKFIDLPRSQRFKLDAEACMIYLGKKVETRDKLVKSIQGKYRDLDTWR
ncbi:hypothetical protein, partial [Parvibaculum sp.]|uniref:hypothetical protein n=1 Tax=Parvibaculum sp. TaxID=2024848 RepID=UPI002C05F1FA